MGRALDHFVVYWLFDSECITPKTDGYVGCSNNPTRQAWRYREAKKFDNKEFQIKILYWGTQAECLAVECQLRPRPGIGWNLGTGGFKDGGGGRGVPKSPEHRAKQSAAALRRYTDPKEHKRTSEAVKRGFKKAGINHIGVNNPMFGRTQTAKTRRKISKAKRS